MNNAENQNQSKVLVNAEGQYSIWPAKKAIPDGWQSCGKEGAREECLAFVEEAWDDMRSPA
ncbi:MAG: MbtH family protein [Parvularculaceae bacterium]